METLVNDSFPRFARPMRFGLVGISGMAVNSAIVWLLVRELRLAVPIASALATEVAILCNFALNDRWTFRGAARERPVVDRLLRYNGVALGGLAITAGLLTLLTTFAHMHLLVANLLAIGAATAWNYLASSRWTWRSSGGRSLGAAAVDLSPPIGGRWSTVGGRQSAVGGETVMSTAYCHLPTDDVEVAL